MKATLSVGLLITALDNTSQLSCFKAIGNRALGQAIFAAQRIVRDEQDENAREPRAAPIGLEARENPHTQLEHYTKIYVSAAAKCEQLKTNDYDLPQDVESRVAWMLLRSRDALGSQPQSLTSRADKLAFAARVSTAKNDYEFWQKNHAKVT